VQSSRWGITVVALLAIGVPIVVAIAFLWLHAAVDRRNRRSMRRYESALHQLGDVARRSDATAPVHLPSPDAIARPHVGIEPPSTSSLPEQSLAPLRARLTPPLTPGGAGSLPLFDDVHPLEEMESNAKTDNSAAAALARMVQRSRSSHETVGPLGELRHPGDTEIGRLRRIPPPTLLFDAIASEDDAGPADLPDGVTMLSPRTGIARLPSGARPSLDHARTTRFKVTAVVATVVILAVIGFVISTVASSPPKASLPLSSTTIPKVHATTTTAAPTVLDPASVTRKLVVYDVASATYTVRFEATAPCWLGSQSTVGGPYLWMDTLEAGQTTTYGATGTRVIRLGAPKALSVSVNGIPVALPPGNIQPYDLELRVR
jgi:hypothetical protein